MGIFLQLSAETFTALFATMQPVQGPQKQYVSVYNVQDADREKEAGNRRMWSGPVKMKHWAERLDMDMHIFFQESKFQDWSAYGAIQSLGRRKALKGPSIPDLTQPTISVTQDDPFALGMGCPSPDITAKYPVFRHPLPDPPSRTPEEYEATGYRLVEDVLPGHFVDQLCAVLLEGDENWEDILLWGHNQGGGRRQSAPGTVNKWLPSEIKWRLLRILADLFPVLDDLADREPRLVERMDAPPRRGYQWPPRDFMLTLRGAADTRVVFVSLQDDPPEKSLQIAPGTSHGYHASNTWHVVQQKRGSVLLMDGTLNHRGAAGPGRTMFSPFVPEKFRTPPNVVEPENVPDLMFVEPEEPEEAQAEEDPPATSSGSDLQPPAPPAPRLSWSAPLKTPPGMEKKVPDMGDMWVIRTGVGTAAISVRPFTTEGLCSGLGSVPAASSSPAHPAPVRCSGLQW